jgi:hypothetical protein
LPRSAVRGPRPTAGVLLAAAISACYAPKVHDCELSCASAADCAAGQRCGADQLCAARGVTCAAPVIDAGVGLDARGLPADGKPHADAKPVDASVDVVLTVMITGMGTVVVSGGPACPMTGPCQLSVPIDDLTTLIAQPGKQSMFDAWTTGPCTGQGATCTLVPTGSTTLAVRFTKLAM